jgi:ABC-2 type transport system ATP-binding protein
MEPGIDDGPMVIPSGGAPATPITGQSPAPPVYYSSRSPAGPDRPLGAPVIDVEGLTKRYRSGPAIRDISFQVHRGELFGLLGSNGAGKTTAVEILQGLRPADGGRVSVLGLDPATGGSRLRRRIGSQLQDSSLPDRLRVGEALRFFASFVPSARPVEELAEEWDLTRLLDRSFERLSGGERQRLFIALALVGRPELVFLDELTQNLDPVARRRTWDLVRRVRDSGTTVVLVTHDIEEAGQLCDRVVVLHRGRVVAEGTPSALTGGSEVEVTVTCTDPEADVDRLARLPGARRAGRRGPTVWVTGNGALLAQVGAPLVGEGRPPVDLTVERPSLEERVIALTTAEDRAAEDSATEDRTAGDGQHRQADSNERQEMFT